MALTKQEIQHERVLNLRIKHGLTQNHIASVCGYTPQRISDIEQKNSCIDEEALLKLSDILVCSPDYLLGLVDEPNLMLSGYYDKNGKRKILRSLWQLGNFRDTLISKFYTLPPNKRSILYTLMDCLKNCSDAEAKTFESMSKAFFHFNPKYEKATLRSHDYIFTTLRNEILPAIEEDAYKFIFSTFSSDLDLCKMSDSDFESAISQSLGDFKKECKQKLHLKIRGAVIPYKQTLDNSISESDIDDMINYVLDCLQSDVETKLASDSFKKQFKSSKYISLSKGYIAPKDISQVLDDIIAFIKADTKTALNKEPIKIPSVKSHKDKAKILRELRRTLYLRKDTYAKELLKDIKNFFK